MVSNNMFIQGLGQSCSQPDMNQLSGQLHSPDYKANPANNLGTVRESGCTQAHQQACSGSGCVSMCLCCRQYLPLLQTSFALARSGEGGSHY